MELDRAESTVQKQLDRVRELLADRQWQEAVETLRQVMESSGDRLMPVTERRFVTVRDYCNLQLASLPPEALSVYRGLVDGQAKRWYEEGVAARDRRLLERVVAEAFASRWGDNALYALGEVALEQGDYAAARAAWEKVIPVSQEGTRTWLSVPGTEIDLASVRARLVLASILEGSAVRAKEELAQFGRMHPAARGRIGGTERNFFEFLTALAAESSQWPSHPVPPNWPTFAGSDGRNRIAAALGEATAVAWRRRLPEQTVTAKSVARSLRRVAEDPRAPLSYHPVCSDGMVLLNSASEILALDARTGQPAWGHGDAVLFRDALDRAARDDFLPPDTIGAVRFTMTVCQGRLFARMGTAVTSRPPQSSLAAEPGYLVCLDLHAEGRLAWKITTESKDWAFEGTPVSDGPNVFVAMRRGDIRPQAHVACYDAETGELRWRRFIAGADTPGRHLFHETSHNLLTLDHRTLYYSTNLGAVAALSADDGRLKWVSLYPRDRAGDLADLAPHWCRDLTPCLYDRGRLLVAPADSRRLFALDAANGQILWQSGPELDDVVHLLGVAGDTLVASGSRLYWIDLAGRPGMVVHMWPEGNEKPGFGRGLIAGDEVYWPNRETIQVFDAATGRQKRQISLLALGATGGNLAAAGGRLLIAGSQELVALGSRGAEKEDAPDLTAVTAAVRNHIIRPWVRE